MSSRTKPYQALPVPEQAYISLLDSTTSGKDMLSVNFDIARMDLLPASGHMTL